MVNVRVCVCVCVCVRHSRRVCGMGRWMKVRQPCYSDAQQDTHQLGHVLSLSLERRRCRRCASNVSRRRIVDKISHSVTRAITEVRMIKISTPVSKVVVIHLSMTRKMVHDSAITIPSGTEYTLLICKSTEVQLTCESTEMQLTCVCVSPMLEFDSGRCTVR